MPLRRSFVVVGEPVRAVAPSSPPHACDPSQIPNPSHVKWLRPTAVSSGSVAASATDGQGASDGTNSAAGTGVSTFVATFSPI